MALEGLAAEDGIRHATRPGRVAPFLVLLDHCKILILIIAEYRKIDTLLPNGQRLVHGRWPAIHPQGEPRNLTNGTDSPKPRWMPLAQSEAMRAQLSLLSPPEAPSLPPSPSSPSSPGSAALFET